MRTALVLVFWAIGVRHAQADVSMEDLKSLLKVGMSEQFLEKYLKANAPVSAYPAGDLNELRKAGLGEKLVEMLRKGIPREPAPGAPPAGPRRRLLFWPVPGMFLPVPLDAGVPLAGVPLGKAEGPPPSLFLRDPYRDPLGGFAFPAYGYSYYPRLQYYAPSSSYLSPGYGFSYPAER